MVAELRILLLVHLQEVLEVHLLLGLIAAAEQQTQLEAGLRYGHWVGGETKETDG